ncbi:unnamed protein product [Vitrella brassicaformis CCMP3155]|uniref:Uncharacterized protein n=1 Tax=Vitrella brassicaformis (strain CCMP3155) TaxID=1169540 RepID=A0A0G4G5L2_VITBC|nr:unnamed protein product [Vitrella brassicaformis CCMP3155]|eukprot:CEM23837.1 unnamed protein product [Vitrella brassicaformis CCMP3155]
MRVSNGECYGKFKYFEQVLVAGSLRAKLATSASKTWLTAALPTSCCGRSWTSWRPSSPPLQFDVDAILSGSNQSLMTLIKKKATSAGWRDDPAVADAILDKSGAWPASPAKAGSPLKVLCDSTDLGIKMAISLISDLATSLSSDTIHASIQDLGDFLMGTTQSSNIADQQDAAKAKQHDEKLQKGSREVACADSHDSEPADLSLATQTTLISIQMVCVSCSSTTCRPSRRTST